MKLIKIKKLITKAYYEANKDKISQTHKKYYEANKNKLCKTMICACGGKYTLTHKLVHEKSQKHQKFIQQCNV